jgi:protein TonB
MTIRRPGSLAIALAGSIAINVAIAGLAAVLMKERGLPQDITDPVGVRLIELTPPEPPEPEEAKEPEKPEEPQKIDFTPDLMAPDLGPLGSVDGGIAVDLDGVAMADLGNDYVFEAYELDQPPQPIVRVPPSYPFKARERAIEGVVQIKMLVNIDGSVSHLQILDARPKGVFEESVMRAVPQWKFSPGKIEGKAVTAWVVLPIRFTLS